MEKENLGEYGMRIDSGFVDLISADNKLFNMINEETGHNDLGLSMLYDYFADILFPSVSTLMPNLVYCYMIYPLYQKYRDDKSTCDSNINTALGYLTSYKSGNRTSLAGANRGFHGKDIKENIVGTYRNFLRRYGFFEEADDTYIGRLNAELLSTDRCRGISALQYDEGKNGLTEPDQSKETIKADIKAALKKTLTGNEKKDMILRMLYVFGIEYNSRDNTFKLLEKDNTMENEKPSLMEFICLKCLSDKTIYDRFFENNKGYTSLQNECNRLFSLNTNNKRLNNDYYNCMVFENILSDINLKENNSRQMKMLKNYKLARLVMIMEHIIKCRFNELIKIRNKSYMEGNAADVNEEICEFYDNIYNILKCFDAAGLIRESIGLIEDEKKYSDVIELDDVRRKVKELEELYIKVISNTSRDCAVYKEIDSIIWNYGTESSKGRENEEITLKQVSVYYDTFRWEYRPRPDSQNESIKDSWLNRRIFNKKQKEDKRPETKCASFFIYELFFEKE